METMEDIGRRLEAAEDLHSVVKTMKSLSAVAIRQYERAAESLAEYDRAVSLGLQAALLGLPAGQGPEDADRRASGPVIVAALGSDQGLCGPLNDRVAETLADSLVDENREAVVLAAGARLSSVLTDDGFPPVDRFRSPGSIEAVSDVATSALATIDQLREDRNASEVRIVYPERTGAASFEVRTRRVLPLDRLWVASLRRTPWPSRRVPTWPGERRDVLSALIREYLFVAVFRALVDALASEHASRLSSMQSAEKNIEERLEDLESRRRRRRQESITSELMDVISGFEALSGD